MTHKSIHMIGYACGHGAADITTALGPGTFKNQSEFPTNVLWEPIYYSPLETETDTSRPQYVKDYCDHIKQQVKNATLEGHFPITIGGDHSMAIGTWSGIHAAYPDQTLGLIWFDAHMDAHTIDSSPSGNIHGMPLTYLLGIESDDIAQNVVQEAAIHPENLYLVGIRSFEEYEQALLTKSGAHIYYMDEVKQRGLPSICKEIIDELTQKVDRIGLSIDIDAFDPSIAPGTGTTEKEGLDISAVDSIGHILTCPLLAALEIAEFNPYKDTGSKTLDLMTKLCKILY